MDLHQTVHSARAFTGLAAFFASLLATAALAQTPADAAFDSAQALYDKADYERAYQRFAELADAGHADASRIAWLMNRHGLHLYGRTFAATPYQQLSWHWRKNCGLDCAERQQALPVGTGC